MPLVEPLVHDGVDEGRPVEQKALVVVAVVLVTHLLPPVRVPLPQLLVADLLNLQGTEKEGRFTLGTKATGF